MNIKRISTILIATLVLTIPAIQIKESIQQIEYNKESTAQMQIRADELRVAADKAFKKEEARKKAEAQKIAAEKKEKAEEKKRVAAAQAAAAEKAEQERIAAIQAQNAAPVAPQRVSGSGNCEGYRSMVAQYDWDVNTMLRIMKAESGCNPTNHNHADNHRSCLGSYGLMQIGCVHGYSAAYLESPSNNIAAAYKIFKSQGYTAWSTY